MMVLLFFINAGLNKLPKFKPLIISMMPIKPIMIGYHLIKYFLTDNCSFDPIISTNISMGSVPMPNAAINIEPLMGFCMAVAPANAIYTNPQGNMPFNSPPTKALFIDEPFFG